jgi:hypothetical protein
MGKCFARKAGPVLIQVHVHCSSLIISFRELREEILLNASFTAFLDVS